MNKKITASISGLSLLLSTSAGVYAGANLQEIKAYLNGDLKVKVNGQPVQLNDEQGNAILPITYEGNTYLPVRAVAGALKVAVDYDKETSTVLLGEKTEGVAIKTQKFSDADYSKDKKHTTYANKDYQEVLYDVRDAVRSGSFMLFPDKKYQKLVLQIGAVGADIPKIKIEDSDTKALLKEESVAVKDGMKTIEVDISGVKELFIYFEKLNSDAGYVVPLTTSYYK